MTSTFRRICIMGVIGAALMTSACVSTEDLQRVEATANQALSTAQEAQSSAQSAMSTAQQAQATANAAQMEANLAHEEVRQIRVARGERY